jgi:phosphinothricin acetyltransferase
MSAITIRNALAVSDAAACAAIYAPSVERGPVSFEEVAPNAAELAERIERVAASHPWLVAERGGAVVGYAYACPHAQRPAYRWAADVSIYVAAGRQGEGIGRALYGELFERLRRQGLRTAVAGITLPNPASVALHEGLGFTQVGVLEKIGWKDGAWRDVGWWQLELVPGGAGKPPEPLAPEPSPGPG